MEWQPFFQLNHYKENNNPDSIDIHYQNLIDKHPNSPAPYLLRAQYLHYEITDSRNAMIEKRVALLKTALSIAPGNREAVYKISKIYYEDFLAPFKSSENATYSIQNDSIKKLALRTSRIKKRASIFENAGEHAITYLNKLAELDSSYINLVYYPILQIKDYLKITTPTSYVSDLERNKALAFKDLYFAGFEKPWKPKQGLNYLLIGEKSKREVRELSHIFRELKEKILIDEEAKSEIIRLTVHIPYNQHKASISISKKQDEITMLSKSDLNYKTEIFESIAASKESKLDKETWDQLNTKINAMNFEKKPRIDAYDLLMKTKWLIERKSKNGEYHAVYTNLPDQDLEDLCIQILKLAGFNKEQYLFLLEDLK